MVGNNPQAYYSLVSVKDNRQMKQTGRQTDIWRCLSVQYFGIAALLVATIDGEEGGGGIIVGQWGRDTGPFGSYNALLSYPIYVMEQC